MQKMYHELAAWWPLISPLEDYAAEAAFFWQVFSNAGLPDSPSLLELGCGGGSNAFYLKKNFTSVTLSDMSPHMLAVSRSRNPECEHVEGDMRTLRLNREFDAVFIHDAIDYMISAGDLQQAMQTAFVHCKTGGLALLVPDHVRENFEPSTSHHGSDAEGRAIRYLEWTHDPDEADTTCCTDFAYLLRDGNRPVQIIYDQHIYGLFPRDEWLHLLQVTGFTTEIFRDAYGRDLFLARKP